MNKDQLARLNQIQSEILTWSKQNFPNNRPIHPLLGIFEEFGEYKEAITPDEKADAIGDALIYMLDYAARVNVKASYIFGNYKKPLPAIIIFGRLSHHNLKLEQNIRKNEDHLAHIKSLLVSVKDKLYFYAMDCGIDPISTLEETWTQVSKRNWQENRIDGSN